MIKMHLLHDEQIKLQRYFVAFAMVAHIYMVIGVCQKSTSDPSSYQVVSYLKGHFGAEALEIAKITKNY